MGEEHTRGNSAGDSGWMTTQVAAEGKIREKSAAAEDFAELIRDLTTQVVKTSTEAAALRVRLQLTE